MKYCLLLVGNIVDSKSTSNITQCKYARKANNSLKHTKHLGTHVDEHVKPVCNPLCAVP